MAPSSRCPARSIASAAVREPGEERPLLLAATDPANPYGVSVDWPAPNLQRAAGRTWPWWGVWRRCMSRRAAGASSRCVHSTARGSRRPSTALKGLLGEGRFRRISVEKLDPALEPFLREGGFVPTPEGARALLLKATRSCGPATALRTWIVGRQVTGAASLKIRAERLVGDEVDEVEARGKHLLIRFAGGLTLHTHMRMTGSWHLYRRGDQWRKPKHLARVVLECGERIAVCFSAPVIELLPTRTEFAHAVLAGLGPDILKPPVTLTTSCGAPRERPPDTPIGDVLLDQQVVCGHRQHLAVRGDVRCGVNPAAPQREGRPRRGGPYCGASDAGPSAPRRGLPAAGLQPGEAAMPAMPHRDQGAAGWADDGPHRRYWCPALPAVALARRVSWLGPRGSRRSQ